MFSVVITIVGNCAMCGNFKTQKKIFRSPQVIQQDNATRKSQRVSIHIVFVTNRLVKSKPGLIRSIRSSLEPCTATSDIFSLSRLAELPLVQSTPSSFNPSPRVRAERTVAKTVPKLTLFGPAPTRQLRRRPETEGPPWHARTAYCLGIVVQQETQS